MQVGNGRGLKNDDRIAQPVRGRFLPLTVAETIKFLRDLGFAVPSYRKRPNITYRNLDAVGSYGRIVAPLSPADEMIIYSVPEDLDCQRARQMLESTFRKFAELEKGAKV